MEKIKRKILALLLTASVLFGSVSAGAFAAETAGESGSVQAAQASETSEVSDGGSAGQTNQASEASSDGSGEQTSEAQTPDGGSAGQANQASEASSDGSEAAQEEPRPTEGPVIDTDRNVDPVVYYKYTYPLSAYIQPLSVAAHAADGGTLSYQWYKGTDPGDITSKISGGTRSSYTPASTSAGKLYYYQVTVTDAKNGQSVKSAAAEVLFIAQPSSTNAKIVEDKSEDAVPADGYSYSVGDTSITLTADAGNGTWNYTWVRYNSSYSSTFLSEDSAFTPPTDQNGTHTYECFLLQCDESGKPVFDQSGKPQCTKTDTVTVKVCAESAEEPTITAQPVDEAYEIGTRNVGELSVSASVTDGGELSYQWYRSSDGQNFSPIDGAFSSTYVPEASETAAAHYYYCTVTNTLKSANGKTYVSDSVSSDSAKVTFNASSFAWQGSGTEDSPYLLSTPDDLRLLEKRVNTGYSSFEDASFKLTRDITLPSDWAPIGALKNGAVVDTDKSSQSSINRGKSIWPFSGTFDGGGHTLTIPEGGLPLFGYVRGATVKNLNIYGKKIAGYGLVNNYCVDYGPTGSYSDWTENASYPDMPLTIEIDGVTLKSGSSTLKSGFIGGYASGADTVIIHGCTVESGVTVGYDGTRSNIGSFAGYFNGTMESCVSSATVEGKDSVGGLVGSKGQSMGNCNIWDSAFHGTVLASGDCAGGLIGSGYNDGSYSSGSAPNTPCVTIQNCYADGSVTGADDVGGLLGTEPSCKQCWANGIGYIQNNYFAGKVSAGADEHAADTDSSFANSLKTAFTGIVTEIKAMAGIDTNSDNEGLHVGGIVGNMRSLDRYNVISNNYYLDTCGASAGVGGVDAVAKVPEPQNVAASNTKSLAGIRLLQSFGSSTSSDDAERYGRTDDPTGTDAARLAAPVTAEQLGSGSVLARLNAGVNGSGTWVKGDSGYPELDSDKKHMLFLTVTDYTKRCAGGSSLSLSAVAVYSNGSEESVAQSMMRVSGFDSSTEGYDTVTATYQNHASLFEVRITSDAEESSQPPVTVSFRLIGATKSTGAVDLKDGDYKGSKYVTWIPTTAYTLPAGSTAGDLLQKALESPAPPSAF